MTDIPFEQIEIGTSRTSGGLTITETDIVLHSTSVGNA
jgi:hypothetical protein